MKTTRTLPIGIWLGLTLLAVVAIPMLAMFAVAAHSVKTAAAPVTNIMRYRQELTDNAANWTAPVWQQAEGDKLREAGIGVMLYNGDGQMIYRSDAGQPGVAGQIVLGAPLGPDGNLLPPPSDQKDVTFIYTAQTRPVTAIKLTEGDTLLGTALFSAGTPAKAFEVRAIAPNIFQTWLLQLAGPSSLRIALTGLVTLIVTPMLASWVLRPSL